jgi:hypothetical protein
MMDYTFTAPIKDPDAVLRHGHDLSAWLEEEETVSAFAVTAQAGITVDQVYEDAGIVSYRIAGGTAGHDYLVTCRVTTDHGRIDERSARYSVRQR